MRLFKVQETRLIGRNTLLLTISPKRKRDAFRFYPGQYAAIGFKRGGRPSPMRCFSIVSSPRNPDAVQFAMRIQGDFTTALSELQQNDTVFLRGPFGDFLLDEEYDRNVIMLAGGIGITPFMSMIRYAAEINSQIPMTLLYSCSYPDDIPFMDELLELEQRNPRFKAAFFTTRGSVDTTQNIRRLAGRIDEDRLQQLTGGNYHKFTYFVCGPKQFTKSLSTTLLANDVAADRIITEEFTPSSAAAGTATMPRYSITRWTYGLTGATLLLAAGFFMALDLARYVPKVAAASSTSHGSDTSQAAAANSADTNSSSNYDSGYQSNAAQASSDTSSAPASSNYSAPTPTYTYQPPVTSVS